MTMTLYGIANCDTVKKTKKLLESKKIDYTFYDFKKTAPTHTMIKRWLKEFGADTLINKRGTTWRKLDHLTQALAEGSEQQKIELLITNSSMIKRPIIEFINSEGTKKNMIGFDSIALNIDLL